MRISVEHLGKSYHGTPVLRDVTFTAGPGITCVMAPSGVGKTTLLRLLLGLETPDEGSVRLPENCRWAAVFQEDRLLEHLDAWGNLHLIGTRQGEAAQPQCWQNWGWRRRRKDQCGVLRRNAPASGADPGTPGAF